MHPGGIWSRASTRRSATRFPKGLAVKHLRVPWVFRMADACCVDPGQKTIRDANRQRPELESIAKWAQSNEPDESWLSSGPAEQSNHALIQKLVCQLAMRRARCASLFWLLLRRVPDGCSGHAPDHCAEDAWSHWQGEPRLGRRETPTQNGYDKEGSPPRAGGGRCVGA